MALIGGYHIGNRSAIIKNVAAEIAQRAELVKLTI